MPTCENLVFTSLSGLNGGPLKDMSVTCMYVLKQVRSFVIDDLEMKAPQIV